MEQIEIASSQELLAMTAKINVIASVPHLMRGFNPVLFTGLIQAFFAVRAKPLAERGNPY